MTNTDITADAVIRVYFHLLQAKDSLFLCCRISRQLRCRPPGDLSGNGQAG
jgi:hypothetical protein